MVYALTSSLVSFIIGKLAKHIGLQTIIVMMLLVALSHSIFMLSWTPRYDQGYVVVLMAATFGFTNSLATAQIRGLYGVFFPNDPTAYSAEILFETSGLIIGSLMSIFFQARVKIYLYIGIIVSGVISYVCLEMRHRNRTAKIDELIVDSIAGGVETEADDKVVGIVEKEICGVENPNYDDCYDYIKKESIDI